CVPPETLRHRAARLLCNARLSEGRAQGRRGSLAPRFTGWEVGGLLGSGAAPPSNRMALRGESGWLSDRPLARRQRWSAGLSRSWLDAGWQDLHRTLREQGTPIQSSNAGEGAASMDTKTVSGRFRRHDQEACRDSS